jgi:hypothetical protein
MIATGERLQGLYAYNIPFDNKARLSTISTCPAPPPYFDGKTTMSNFCGKKLS